MLSSSDEDGKSIIQIIKVFLLGIFLKSSNVHFDCRVVGNEQAQIT